MTPTDLLIHLPQTIDSEVLSPASSYLLANEEVRVMVDAQSDLVDLVWPRMGQAYAQSIRLSVQTAGGQTLKPEPLTPLINRYYPGYQETIWGNESLIVSKRLVVPLGGVEDRAVLWLLDCEAEGDHLLRLEVEIDWGEPLTQRMVDGLLVAQHNPSQARGVYSQSNAESTRVFGNPHAYPTEANLEHPQRARLVYYLLINGEVQERLLLTLSDVGEQVAWSAFLALRESEETFDKSNAAWEKLLSPGLLLTPDPSLNQAVRSGRIATHKQIHRLRSGLTSADRSLVHLPRLVASSDTFDLRLSRNLLLAARRLAEQSQGCLPVEMPLTAKASLLDPGTQIGRSNGAYLAALHIHLRHHFDADLLAEHRDAMQQCSQMLARSRQAQLSPLQPDEVRQHETALHHALQLAWLQPNLPLSDASDQSDQSDQSDSTPSWETWPARYTWHKHADQPWSFSTPWHGVGLAGDVIWLGCGILLQKGIIQVNPTWPQHWSWWLLIDLPTPLGKLSLVWDGKLLHSTLPLQSQLPLQLHPSIRLLGMDEDKFDPRIEFTDAEKQRTLFRLHDFQNR